MSSKAQLQVHRKKILVTLFIGAIAASAIIIIVAMNARDELGVLPEDKWRIVEDNDPLHWDHIQRSGAFTQTWLIGINIGIYPNDETIPVYVCAATNEQIETAFDINLPSFDEIRDDQGTLITKGFIIYRDAVDDNGGHSYVFIFRSSTTGAPAPWGWFSFIPSMSSLTFSQVLKRTIFESNLRDSPF